MSSDGVGGGDVMGGERVRSSDTESGLERGTLG